jgi:Family of unknown function (DUF5755)
MNKRCPPGVICLENITMFFIMIIVVAVIYFVYNSVHEEKRQERHQNRRVENRLRDPNESYFGFFSRPNYPYNNYSNDVLLNPYVPPLSDERYLVPNVSYIPPGTMPINISTNVGAVDTNYRQMGLLTPLNDSGKLLPLMGRPLYTNRNKWQYYTMSDQNNSIKLPIVKNGRSCTNEYGCDELYGGDNVFVEGYNQAFKVTIYDSNSVKYLPFI